VVKGKAAGEAVVSLTPIGFAGGVNPETGCIVEKDHELEGVNITGKILIFPVEKGSTGGSDIIYEMVKLNKGPNGIINLRAKSIVVVGAIIANLPVVDRLDGNPQELIQTGDYVEMDADEGTVKVRKQGETE
jgi:predicted aconitase with swiveling domain